MRQQYEAGKAPRLFIGVFPCGISYADRHHEEYGDYKALAFLPYESLTLEFRKWFRQLDLAPFDGLNWPHLEACDLSFRVGLGGRSP
jgi:hypothetical protein